MKSLATRIVRTIKDIDHEQTEGGIYALPERCSKGMWPAGHHHIFGGALKELDLFSRLGMSGQEERKKWIEFFIEKYQVPWNLSISRSPRFVLTGTLFGLTVIMERNGRTTHPT